MAMFTDFSGEHMQAASTGLGLVLVYRIFDRED
jgi:hypothetical protein